MPPRLSGLSVTDETFDEGGRPWWRRFDRPLRLAGSLAALGLIFACLRCSTSDSYPDRQQAQQEVESGVGQAENTTVTAVCTVPDKNGYTCQLRDAAGRYGYALTTFAGGSGTPGPHSRFGPTRHSDTTWGFPLNADGTGTQTLDTSPPRDLSLGVTAAVQMVGDALGSDLLDLFDAVKCGDDPAPTAVTDCAVRAPFLSATLRPLGNNTYQFAYRVSLPGQ